MKTFAVASTIEEARTHGVHAVEQGFVTREGYEVLKRRLEVAEAWIANATLSGGINRHDLSRPTAITEQNTPSEKQEVETLRLKSEEHSRHTNLVVDIVRQRAQELYPNVAKMTLDRIMENVIDKPRKSPNFQDIRKLARSSPGSPHRNVIALFFLRI